MIVNIDAPPIRSLNENEKIVYKLIKEGKTPFEVARIMHIPYRMSYTANFDVPVLSVQGIISSIRGKGWELPDFIQKEKNDMNKYSPEVKKDALKLHFEGIPTYEIAERLGILYKTVWRWIHNCNADIDEYNRALEKCDKAHCIKREPAPSANDTSSNENIPVIIINSASEFVKPVSSGVIQEAIHEALFQKAEEQRENDNLISQLKKQLASAEAYGELLRYEYDELSSWYDYISREE